MSSSITKSCFYELPSGQSVHPCRLIHKDGTLMWKHALLYQNESNLPLTQAHEVHIVKTAQRIEELNSWVSQSLEPWDCLLPSAWYVPTEPDLSEGISLYFKHHSYPTEHTFENIKPHIQSHETLELRGNYLFFKRC